MLVLDLPSTEYLRSLEIQTRLVERIIATGGPDVLVLVEHPPTVTLGVRGAATHLLVPKAELKRRRVAVHSVNRGGEATYHGAGQLVGYPIVNLRKRRLSARNYVTGLEETIIVTLKSFGIIGFRKQGEAGVWTAASEKIASIGVRLQNRVTSHGFSLNVSLDTDPRDLIVCCGSPETRMVSMDDLTQTPTPIRAVRDSIKDSFCRVFNVTLEACSLETVLDSH